MSFPSTALILLVYRIFSTLISEGSTTLLFRTIVLRFSVKKDKNITFGTSAKIELLTFSPTQHQYVHCQGSLWHQVRVKKTISCTQKMPCLEEAHLLTRNKLYTIPIQSTVVQILRKIDQDMVRHILLCSKIHLYSCNTRVDLALGKIEKM